MENKHPVKEDGPLDNLEQKSPIELVKEVDKELSEYRKQFEKPWREYDDAYHGKQHKTGEDRKTVKNHIFKIIEGEVPILTDSMPGTQVTADLSDKQVDADNLNKAIKYVYQDQNLPLILPSLVRQSCISAPGFLYVHFNPDADGGEGKIEYRQLPWDYVKLDGNAQTIEQAERANIKIPMRKGAMARMWPEKREEILNKQADKDSQEHGDDGNFETRDVSGGNSDPGKPRRHTHKDIVNYLETWIKSYDLENIPGEDTQEELETEHGELLGGNVPSVGKWENHAAHQAAHAQTRAEVLAQLGLPGNAPYEQVVQAVEQIMAANPQAQGLDKIPLIVKIIDNHSEEHEELKRLNPKGQRPKYKDGWRVIKSVGDILLYDGGNPEERLGFGHIPLVPFYCYKDDTIYGFGEIKNIIDPQRTLNDVDWREFENLKQNANTGWVADHEADVDEGKLTNAPGIVVKKKKGTEVKRLEPGQVSPQLERRKDTDELAMEDISGINESTQGNVQPGASSGIAIQKLQAQAIGRIRLKDRYLQHYSIKRLGMITGQLILNHWTDEKILRLRSDNGDVEEVVFNPLTMQDLGYTVEISPGSMAGIDKDALNNFFMQLLDKQHIVFEDFLMVADFPKKELLLSRLKERQEQEQTLEQAQAQLQELQMQNAHLKGLVSPNLVEGDEKKVFDMAARQALINQMIQAQAAKEQEQNGNPAAIPGQAENQGNM